MQSLFHVETDREQPILAFARCSAGADAIGSRLYKLGYLTLAALKGHATLVAFF